MENEKDLTVYDTRHYPIRPHIGVGAMLIRNNTLLLIKRKYNPDSGYWSIPGGHLNLGELVEDAAIRETLEETGFKTKITSLAGIINKIMHDDEGKIEYHYVLLNYFVEQVEGPADQAPMADDDALDAKFVPFNKLRNYELTESLIELLKKLEMY
ncbi:MAG: NUDIX hydrolase [Promethearchaeota archaeon]